MPDDDTAPPSPSRVWGTHYLDCPTCTLGDTPIEDVFCDEGRALHADAVDDIHRRASGIPLGEVLP